ncbi:MAG: hypothetical protein NTY74_14615 [Ignavibacteriae bacterium]|nr:hypothetical protein [Ignavibacteriota bacterium]
MFPHYGKSFNEEEFFGINGFEKIPVYRKLEVIEPATEYLVSSIKTLGENCCGNIENCAVNYHYCEKDSYFINMDNKYVFAYFKDNEYSGSMPVVMLLEFLKYKAEKILLIYEDTHFLLKKTDDTYKVCEKMDEIFISHSFSHNVLIKSVGGGNYEELFHKLMEIYSMKYMNKDVRNYGIIDILLKVLKLDLS